MWVCMHRDTTHMCVVDCLESLFHEKMDNTSEKTYTMWETFPGEI